MGKKKKEKKEKKGKDKEEKTEKENSIGSEIGQFIMNCLEGLVALLALALFFLGVSKLLVWGLSFTLLFVLLSFEYKLAGGEDLKFYEAAILAILGFAPMWTPKLLPAPFSEIALWDIPLGGILSVGTSIFLAILGIQAYQIYRGWPGSGK